MLALPPIAVPQRYVGLYVYDFKTHVAVGYTAGEIRILRRSPEHRSGTAYEIYRVDEEERIELRGVSDARLAAVEAMCFLRDSVEAARADYDAVRSAALDEPVGFVAELRLARVPAFEPRYATGLTYPAAAERALVRWLESRAIVAGDLVIGGANAHGQLVGNDAELLASCLLPSQIDYRDRPAEVVLATVGEPLQR